MQIGSLEDPIRFEYVTALNILFLLSLYRLPGPLASIISRYTLYTAGWVAG